MGIDFSFKSFLFPQHDLYYNDQGPKTLKDCLENIYVKTTQHHSQCLSHLEHIQKCNVFNLWEVFKDINVNFSKMLSTIRHWFVLQHLIAYDQAAMSLLLVPQKYLHQSKSARQDRRHSENQLMNFKAQYKAQSFRDDWQHCGKLKN